MNYFKQTFLSEDKNILIIFWLKIVDPQKFIQNLIPKYDRGFLEETKKDDRDEEIDDYDQREIEAQF